MKHFFLFVLLCTSMLYPINISVNVHYDYLDKPVCMTTKFVVNDKDTVGIDNWHNNPFTVIDSVITFKLAVTAPWSGTIKIIRKKFTFTNVIFDVTNATSDMTFDTYGKIKTTTIIGKTLAINGDSLSNIKILNGTTETTSKKGIYSYTENMYSQLSGKIFYYHTSFNLENAIGYIELKPTDPIAIDADSIIMCCIKTNKTITVAFNDTIPGPDYLASLETLSGKVITNGNDPINNVSIKLIGNTILYDTTDSAGEFSFKVSPQFHGYLSPTKTNYSFTPSLMEVNFGDVIIFKGKLNTGIPEFTCKAIDTITSSNTIGFIFNIDYNNPTSFKDSIIIIKLPSWLAFTNNKLIGINQATSIYDTVKLALMVNNVNIDTLILTLYMPNIVSIITPIKHLTKNYTISQIALYDLKGRLITTCNPNELNKILASKSKMVIITKSFTKSLTLINKSISK